MEVFEKIKREVLEKNLIRPGDRVVIGCSGGPDSMFLTEFFRKYREEWSLELIIAHVNHGVRGEAAKKDAEFVRDYCLRHSLTYRLYNTNMNQKAAEWQVSPEEAGRRLRYRFFYRLAGEKGKVAVAHTFDDQAETVLMRLIRGSGPDGTGGMEEKKGQLIRPLLGIRRRELIQALESRGIEYRIDGTNLETEYTRNFIRRKILPLMKELNPNVKSALVRYSELEREDREYFERETEKYIGRYVAFENGDAIFDDKVLDLPEALGNRILRSLFERVAGTGKDFTKHHTEILREGLTLQSGKSLDLPEDIVLSSEFGKYRLGKRREPVREEVFLRIGRNQTPWGIFTVEYVEEYSISGKREAVFSGDLPVETLKLRIRRPGDRMIPFGRSSNVKVKDIFQSEKIPVSRRDDIPFLLSGEEILWIPGVRRGNGYLYRGGKGIKITNEVEL